MFIPSFPSPAAAIAAGWIIKPPKTVEHNGWIIISDKPPTGLRLMIRERSGRMVDIGGFQLPRLGNPGHGGRIVKFRWIRVPAHWQPKSQLIFIENQVSAAGAPMPETQATRVEDWGTAVDWAKSAIDARLEGRKIPHGLPPMADLIDEDDR